jgi:Carboxypeptidase regulatory-like domain
MRLYMLVAAIIAALASPAFAQQGQINGVITDSSGGVVPGVTVTAVEAQTGLSREAVTGANGRYNFPSMRPTVYEITAALAGFRTARRTGVELQASQALTVNVILELGELSETVTVAGLAAQVDITTATISEVVDHARIVELPLNGRDAAKLTTLVAGTIIGSISTESGKSIPGGLRLSTNGSEEKDVSFRTSRRTRHSPSLRPYRSSRSRRATTARHRATRRAPSSTPSPDRARTVFTAAASATCAT